MSDIEKFFKFNNIIKGNEKWKFYNFILFFECHRHIVEESFLEFYKLVYSRYPNYYLYGSSVAFRDGVEKEVNNLVDRENLSLSDEKIKEIVTAATKSAQFIARLVYLNCDKDEYDEYVTVFNKWHPNIDTQLKEKFE